jgi:hypothetical protein
VKLAFTTSKIRASFIPLYPLLSPPSHLGNI